MGLGNGWIRGRCTGGRRVRSTTQFKLTPKRDGFYYIVNTETGKKAAKRDSKGVLKALKFKTLPKALHIVTTMNKLKDEV